MELNPEIIFTPSQVIVSEDQISAFEKLTGFKFPEDYRNFLKRFNGPKIKPTDPSVDPSDCYLTMDLRGYSGLGDTKSCDVSAWLGLADPNAVYRYGILEQYEVSSGDWRLPKSLIPIATSVGPAKVYLSLAEDHYGHVLLVGDDVVDRQADELEIRTSDFVLFATSFTEFVSKLKWTNPDQDDD